MKDHGLALIQHNVIDNNIGGGIYKSQGILQNNIISRNTGVDTGGLNDCGGAIQNNTISHNIATGSKGGGGLNYCNGIIQNNTISRNIAKNSSGGGLGSCSGTIQNNFIWMNSSVSGGGIGGCNGGVIRNNTIWNNRASANGGGIYNSNSSVTNCIIWGNSAPAGRTEIYNSSAPTYCCIQDWTGGGTANITADPKLLLPESGDFHLNADSSCIDSGCRISDFFYDFEGDKRGYNGSLEVRGDGSDYDIGADEYNGIVPVPSPTPGPCIIKVPADQPTIQVAINYAKDECEIIVSPGEYKENINFKGKNIILRSTEPTNPSVVAGTIINGNQAGSVVTFSGMETARCVLDGFTIMNGKAAKGGGINGNSCYARIQNNVIRKNTADSSGAGIYNSNGIIQNNTISDNSRGALDNCDGTIQNNMIFGNYGGLSYCDGTIQNNTISGNTGSGLYNCGGTIQNNTISRNAGSGLSYCDGTIQNNTISDNTTTNENFGGGLTHCKGTIQNNNISRNVSIKGSGGGLNYCSGVIQNNFIWMNSAKNGGGLYYCNGGAIRNNTIWNNRASVNGEGISESSSSITNCIIWGNSTPDSVTQIYNSSAPTYCCIQGWTGGGTGNFNADPRLLLPEFGEFYLQADSPCIDAGCLIGGLTKDFEGDTRPFNGTNEVRGDGSDYDIGADEYTGIVPVPTPTPVPCVINVPKDKPSIQTAIEAAEDGCEIIVSPGEYRENINFKGKNIVLHSIDPSNESVVAKTIINGTQWNSVVTFKGVETGFCVLDGFTITYGLGDTAGGIKGNGCLARIQNNIIQYNTASNVAGGISACNGIIRNNKIIGNLVRGDSSGGGLSNCNGAIQNNIISENTATGTGVGGLYRCDGIIQNNIISRNYGKHYGGLGYCKAIIQNNIISRNVSINGSGGGLNYCSGTIQNNFIWMNSAASGGGLYGCSGVIRNNTIWNNKASEKGGGIFNCSGSITNCIIWDNSASLGGHQIYNSSTPSYCCIQNWTGGGIGNINSDPKMLLPESGEFHLKADSPCIDAGCSISDLLYDYDGDIQGYNGSFEVRGDGSDYDIGADEFNGVVPPAPNPPAAKIIISQGSQLFLNDPQHAGKYDINAYAGYTDTGALKFWRRAFGSSMSNGFTIAAGDPGEIVVGQREMGQNWFRILKNSDGSGVKWGQAFAPDGSIDGIRVRAYDLDGDGQKEIFCGSIGEQNIIACYKRNGAFVGVWHMFRNGDGSDFDFDIGDIDGDGLCEIVAGKGPGAQWDDYWNKGVNDFAIYKWTGSYFKFISYHKAYDRYEGNGVSIAVGDVFPENPGLEIVCAQRGLACNEAGCKNYYKVFDYSGNLLYRGRAFTENDGEGLTLSCGDWDNDGCDEIFIGQAHCGINKYAVIQLNWYYRYDNFCIYELTGQGFSPEDCDKIYVIPVK